MIRIRLHGGKWEYDPNTPLGPAGGFGEVFVGKGENHDTVAVKRLKVDAHDAAHRELRIAHELTQLSLKCVVPILDAGLDAESDSYFIIMPKAEKSLQQELDRIGSFSEQETVRILIDIASGLAEVSGIVHRDLKPGNVLYHDGRWKIADFGIARFVEESTSLRTLKRCLTYAYAAPEQWRLERATSATDIYALGCIIHSLLTGTPPFPGPRAEEYYEQHLNSAPPSLDNSHPILRSLAATMLRKPPQSRPSIERVIQRLNEFSSNDNAEGEGLNALAEAGAIDAEAVARSEAAQTAEEAKRKARKELADHANQELRKIIEILFGKIQRAAPTVSRTNADLLEIRLGSAQLEILPFPRNYSLDAFASVGWDVVEAAIVQVTQVEPNRYEWGANLWYTDLGRGQGYRWWQIMYFAPLRKHQRFQPFALSNPVKAAAIVSPRMTGIEFAAKPRPIDDENTDDFCDFWANLLAQAYRGELKHPSHLPLD